MSTLTFPATAGAAAAAKVAGAGILPAIRQAAGLLGRVYLVHRQRRALLALDDRLLADIGIDRGAARREAARGLLDLPVSG